MAYWACKPRGKLAEARKMLVRFSKFYDNWANVTESMGM